VTRRRLLLFIACIAVLLVLALMWLAVLGVAAELNWGLVI